MALQGFGEPFEKIRTCLSNSAAQDDSLGIEHVDQRVDADRQTSDRILPESLRLRFTLPGIPD
jgi:hypothetical protein